MIAAPPESGALGDRCEKQDVLEPWGNGNEVLLSLLDAFALTDSVVDHGRP